MPDLAMIGSMWELLVPWGVTTTGTTTHRGPEGPIRSVPLPIEEKEIDMQRSVSKPWFYLLSALAAVLVTGIAVAGDEPVEVEKKIVVKKMHGMGGHGMHGMHGMEGGAFLGVGLSPLTPELRAHFGVPEDLGVMVSKVEADSPAARAGVEVGDIIARVGGDDIGSASALAMNIRHREDGENVDLEVWRDGQVETLQATLAAREGMGMAGHHKMIVQVRRRRGLRSSRRLRLRRRRGLPGRGDVRRRGLRLHRQRRGDRLRGSAPDASDAPGPRGSPHRAPSRRRGRRESAPPLALQQV